MIGFKLMKTWKEQSKSSELYEMVHHSYVWSLESKITEEKSLNLDKDEVYSSSIKCLWKYPVHVVIVVNDEMKGTSYW